MNLKVYHKLTAEKKKSLNFLSGLIRKNPNNNELRQKYFLQLKSFKKAIKQKKKQAFKQSIYDKLLDFFIY
jgi:hypothetical protein